MLLYYAVLYQLYCVALTCIISCYARMYYTMLRRIVLYCVTFCYVPLYYVMLCYIMVCCVVLGYVMFSSVISTHAIVNVLLCNLCILPCVISESAVKYLCFPVEGKLTPKLGDASPPGAAECHHCHCSPTRFGAQWRHTQRFSLQETCPRNSLQSFIAQETLPRPVACHVAAGGTVKRAARSRSESLAPEGHKAKASHTFKFHPGLRRFPALW